MANNNRVRWLGLAITVFCVFAAVVASCIWVKADVVAVDIKATAINESMGMLKEEGCLPARDNGYSIVKIETQLKAIQTQQKTAFDEILKRLPK